MSLAIVFCLVFTLNAAHIYGQSCNEACVPFTSCPEALDIAKNKMTPENGEKLRNAACESANGHSLPKVCCSKLSPTLDSRLSDSVALDNHPNIKLLPNPCGQIGHFRIVGGKVTDVAEFPWMALLAYKTADGKHAFRCGGSLINKNYILTAAHCISDTLVGIRLGEHDIESTIDCEKNRCFSYTQDIFINKTITHAQYQGLPIVLNDIALIRLATPANLTAENIDPICLPVNKLLRERNLSQQPITVAGWGATESGYSSSKLQKVDVPVHSLEECNKIYHITRGENYKRLCAGSLGKDSCSGDSGGPLMLEGYFKEKISIIQHGIVSFGPKECGTIPGVYTDVTQYMQWILDQMEP